MVDGDGPWLAGSRIRLEHVRSGANLQTHPAPGDDEQEVTASALPDDDGWWTVLEVG
ncbi:hypothetical protein [Cellulomonas soli]